MFCPSCGTEYTIELKYCNRCGANLGTNLAPQSAPAIINITKPTLIISSLILLITLGGMGGLIGGASAMAPVVRGSDPLIAMIVFGMIMIMVIDIVLVRLLSRVISSTLSSQSQPQFRQSAPPSYAAPALNQPATARLQAVPSVTENTTRFFDNSPAQGSTPNPSAEKFER